ncbi:hypothetical protein ACWEOE_10765 [Amycolatopsis sp. NPDC004368]
MLTDDQIRALLAAAMGYDNRRPGELNLAAWREASDRGRWTFGEAVNAVHEHYATSTEFLMPAHITQRLKADRRHAPLPAERQLPVAPPAEPERVRAAVAEIAQQLGWPERTATVNDPELDHVCPHERCRAGKRRPCGYRLTRGVHKGEWHAISGYHASRTQAALDADQLRAEPQPTEENRDE